MSKKFDATEKTAVLELKCNGKTFFSHVFLGEMTQTFVDMWLDMWIESIFAVLEEP